MAITPEAQEQARRHRDLRLVTTSGPWNVRYDDGVKQRTWEVYEVAGSATVAPLENEPVVVRGLEKGGRSWLGAAVDWYQDPNRLGAPLAAGGPPEWLRVAASSPPPPTRPVRPVVVNGVHVNRDRISFDVDPPGSPVLVKTSYFPNWEASGARGPWRVTPNLMAVLPTSRHVELRYARTAVEELGWLLAVLGLASVVVLAWRGVPRPEVASGPGPEADDVQVEGPGTGLEPSGPEPQPATVAADDDG